MTRRRTTRLYAQDKHIRAALGRKQEQEVDRKKKAREEAKATAIKAIKSRSRSEWMREIEKLQAIRVPHPLLPEPQSKKTKPPR